MVQAYLESKHRTHAALPSPLSVSSLTLRSAVLCCVMLCAVLSCPVLCYIPPCHRSTSPQRQQVLSVFDSDMVFGEDPSFEPFQFK